MKKSILFIICCFVLFFGLFAQNKEKAISEPNVTWLGVDFSYAKFTLITEDPATVVNTYFQSINNVIASEPEKYDIRKFFNKSDVTIHLDAVKEKNLKVDPSSLVIENDYNLDAAEISKIVKGYNLKGMSGTGLVFIAGNLNKPKNTGSYYVVFFDMGSREIIDSKKYDGKAVGIGFRNYWAGSVYNIMKTWLKS